MFEEGQLYAPVTTAEDGSVTVHLSDDHPGFADPEYRARRNHIAALALDWTPDMPIPHADYSAVENEVWSTVCRELTAKHEVLVAVARDAVLILPARIGGNRYIFQNIQCRCAEQRG